MSRILHHVGKNDFKKTRQRQIGEQKERAAKELKERQEAEEVRKQIEEESRPYKSHWRLDLLSEAMTTAGLGAINLPAMGDTALDTVPNVTIDDSDALQPYQDYGEPDYAITALDQHLGIIDASKYDTLKLTISGSFNTRTVDGSELNDKVWIGILINGTYAGNYLAQELGAGTHVIPIPARFQKPNMNFAALKVYAFQGITTPTSVTNIQFQRRTPKTVFVPLDDPEANSFIRMGNLDNLSPEGRKKALQEMLDAGDEFMIEYLGLKPSTARPVEMGDEIAGWGLRPDGTSGLNNPGDEVFDPATKTKYKLVPRKGYGYNQWVPVQKAQHVPTDARDYTDQDDPINDSDFPDDPFDDSDFPDLDIPLAKGKKSQYAHYQPEGDVISEKKKLKNPEEVLKKLPGYYDGKPSPAGFPLSPPIIPVDGQHPELINPVKVANRFNRLDPISAKSMPLTGNPHIDKKVKAARKKPK